MGCHLHQMFPMLLITAKVLANSHISQVPIIETSYGKVHGTLLTTLQNPHLKFHAFRGIPYAQPPLKQLRFKPPIPPKSWNSVKPCQNYGPPCLQISNKNGSVLGNEDCLTLNIFSRDLNTSDLKAVMFWIHGGAHIRGSSAEFGPDYLVEKSIVLVTINYRLNVFGFFTTQDENAFGNVGIKDQIAALEWVQGNIAKFGGNPSRVTIFGESSGANSVSLLQLSPRTKGLFHQIIAESGSALNSRYLQREPLKYAYNIARYFNISTDSTRDIVGGLQKIDSQVLTKAANCSEATGYKTNLEAAAFYPVIEVENEAAVLSDSPFETLKRGNFNRVPYIMGYNTNEGSLGLKIVNSEMITGDFDKRPELFAPQSLNNEEEKNTTGTLVREYFLGNASANNSEKFSEFLGEELLVRGIRKAVDFQRQHLDGYFYRFSYKGTHTIPYYGVGHGEELQYLFVRQGTTEGFSEDDILTRKRMVLMWTNFAIFGFPIARDDAALLQNISWDKVNQSSVNFLDIGANLTSTTTPDAGNYKFWGTLFDTYANPPYLTY